MPQRERGAVRRGVWGLALHRFFTKPSHASVWGPSHWLGRMPSDSTRRQLQDPNQGRSAMRMFAALALAAVALAIAAPRGQAAGLSGEVKVDGSSTVYLITEAVASNFKKQHPDVKTTVGISGTGGGFKKF